MSEWYEADPENADIDITEEEFNLFVTSNDRGNIYVTVPFYLIKKMYSEIPDVCKKNDSNGN